jgi:hypothetical protein
MLVRLEALFWCKTAVPAGCVLGIVSTWGLCSFLRGFIGDEFSSLPVFGNCSNTGACEIECPKGISLENIARMNREFLVAKFTTAE